MGIMYTLISIKTIAVNNVKYSITKTTTVVSKLYSEHVDTALLENVTLIALLLTSEPAPSDAKDYRNLLNNTLPIQQKP